MLKSKEEVSRYLDIIKTLLILSLRKTILLCWKLNGLSHNLLWNSRYHTCTNRLWHQHQIHKNPLLLHTLCRKLRSLVLNTSLLFHKTILLLQKLSMAPDYMHCYTLGNQAWKDSQPSLLQTKPSNTPADPIRTLVRTVSARLCSKQDTRSNHRIPSLKCHGTACVYQEILRTTVTPANNLLA